MSEVILDKNEYLKSESYLANHPAQRLKNHFQDKSAQALEDAEKANEVITKTVEGSTLKREQDERINFNLKQNINPLQRIKFIHDYNRKLAELVALHKKGMLTTILK